MTQDCNCDQSLDQRVRLTEAAERIRELEAQLAHERGLPSMWREKWEREYQRHMNARRTRNVEHIVATELRDIINDFDGLHRRTRAKIRRRMAEILDRYESALSVATEQIKQGEQHWREREALVVSLEQARSDERLAVANADRMTNELTEAKRINESHREENGRLRAECEAMRNVVDAARTVAALLLDAQLLIANSVTFPAEHLPKLRSVCEAVSALDNLTSPAAVPEPEKATPGDPPAPLPPIVAEALRRACHNFGSEDTFNLANLSHVITGALGIRGPIDGNWLRLALQSCPHVEQLHGGAHYRVTCCTLPITGIGSVGSATREAAASEPSGSDVMTPTDPPDQPERNCRTCKYTDEPADVEPCDPCIKQDPICGRSFIHWEPKPVEPLKPEDCEYQESADAPCDDLREWYHLHHESEELIDNLRHTVRPGSQRHTWACAIQRNLRRMLSCQQPSAHRYAAAIARAEKAEAELARVREACANLDEAIELNLYRGAGHSHWDSTMKGGAGCRTCHEQCEGRKVIQDALEQLRAALQPPERKDGDK